MNQPIVLRRPIPAEAAARERLRKLAAEKNAKIVSVAGQAGAGRSSLIAAAATPALATLRCAAVIAALRGGDDAERVAGAGLPTVAVDLARIDELDAAIVEQAWRELPDPAIDLLLVERAASMTHTPPDIGEDGKVLVVAVGVAQHLARKYETVFAWADEVVLNMIDLIPLTQFSLQRFEKDLHAVNPHAELIPLSARTGEGLDRWLRWLESRRAADPSRS